MNVFAAQYVVDQERLLEVRTEGVYRSKESAEGALDELRSSETWDRRGYTWVEQWELRP